MLTEEEKKRRHREYNRRYYLNNRERISERKKERYQGYCNRKKEICRRYYLNNRERVIERRKKYYIKNKEKIREYNRKYGHKYWKENHKEVSTILLMRRYSSTEEMKDMKKLRAEIYQIIKRGNIDLSTNEKRKEFVMSIFEW